MTSGSVHRIPLTRPDPLKTADLYESMFGGRRIRVVEEPEEGTTMVRIDTGGVFFHITHP